MNHRRGEPLQAAMDAGYESCLSCHACRAVCPVQAATGRLIPLRTLRTAALGIESPLLKVKQIWYCQQCRRCASHCPMAVSPASLIRDLRKEAIESGVVDSSTIERLDTLQAGLQRVRWHLIERWLRQEGDIDLHRFRVLARLSTERDEPPLVWGSGECEQGTSACMTCRACSTVCPIAHDRDIFDPVVIFRMLNVGQREVLLRSPSIWLCLGCERCSEACTQGISGHIIIEELQHESLLRGLVPSDMKERLAAIDRQVLPLYLDEVDRLFEG